jgi:hypothetical protein
MAKGIKCACGSGLQMRALYDARGIYVSYVCDVCEARTRKRYRPEIFTDSNYETLEAIDEDEDTREVGYDPEAD